MGRDRSPYDQFRRGENRRAAVLFAVVAVLVLFAFFGMPLLTALTR